MRITTSMIMRNYRSNLNNTMVDQERARKQVETGRRFSAAYEDPASAAKGAILEQRYARNTDYLNTAKNAQTWLDSQEDVLNQLNTISVKVREDYAPSALTDTSGEAGRKAYASTLRELQKSMIHTLNTKYGDAYVMAGSDGKNPPFELKDDGTVLYRGVDVTKGDPKNANRLKNLANDHTYIDLGFGMSFDANGVVSSSSAFDTALPGIAAVGYGEEDGISNNIIALIGKMADTLEADTFNAGEFEKYWTRLSDKSDDLQDQFTKIGAKGQLLTATTTKLENEKENIEIQYKDAMGVEAAKAITDYSYAQYVYNAALKVGTSILSPSLLDFMK